MVREPTQQAGPYEAGKQDGTPHGVRHVMRLDYPACASTTFVTPLSPGSSKLASPICR